MSSENKLLHCIGITVSPTMGNLQLDTGLLLQVTRKKRKIVTSKVNLKREAYTKQNNWYLNDWMTEKSN